MKEYYSDSACTIYHGNADDILPGLRAESIITDPPYGVGKDYDGDHYDDDRDDYWEWMQSTLTAMRQVTPTVVFTHRLKALKYLTDWDWVGVWNKPLSLFGLSQFPIMPHWEPIFMYGIQGRKDIPRSFDVISVNPVKSSLSPHPCPKPVGLFTALVGRFSISGETILDPFMGTGTTLVAAKSMGRRAVGIDQSEAYCEIAAKRLAQGVLAL